jgi:hypothetical protein
MCQTSPRTGVCIIRIENQRSGTLLITLVMNPNIDEASSQSSRRLTDVDAALVVVRDFLVDLTGGTPS